MNVLRGAVNTLVRFKPKLFVEIIDTNLKEQDSSAYELISYLKSFGYELHHAETNEIVTSNNLSNYTQFDVIALPIYQN